MTPPRNDSAAEETQRLGADPKTAAAQPPPVATDEAAAEWKPKVVRLNVFLFTLMHIAAVYGLYAMLFKGKWLTIPWVYLMYVVSMLGLTAGAHRLWSHRSYKAKWPLKLILIIFNSVAFQNDIIEWVRDHRGHHKWTDTDGDPHNINRGFFFAHMGWLLTKKHPEVIRRGKTLDLSDVYAEPMLRFQRRYYKAFLLVFWAFIPTAIPVYYWNESISTAFYAAVLFRFMMVLHCTWCVNSVAHRFGYQPYDKKIKAVQSAFTSIGAMGEGWHNYHHTFPSDYKTAETPYMLNPSTLFIDFFASIGWAYDRRTTSEAAIQRQTAKVK